MSHWQFCARLFQKFRLTPVKLSRKVRIPSQPEARRRDGTKLSIEPMRQKSSVHPLKSGFPEPSLHKPTGKSVNSKLIAKRDLGQLFNPGPNHEQSNAERLVCAI